MNTGGDISEQIVRDGMIVFEELAKIAGNLTKETIALLAAILKKEALQKVGKKPVTKLKKIALETGQNFEFFQIKEKDLPKFKSMVAPFGVQYTPVTLKKDGEQLVDMMSLSGDSAAMNRIMEKLGYTVPVRETEKNAAARAASEPNSNERGNGYSQQTLNKGDVIQPLENAAPSKPDAATSPLSQIKHYTQATKAKTRAKAPTRAAKSGPVR